MTNIEVNQIVLDSIKALDIDVISLNFSFTESEVNGDSYSVSLHTKNELDKIKTKDILKRFFENIIYFSVSECYEELDEETFEMYEEPFKYFHLFFSFKLKD